MIDTTTPISNVTLNGTAIPLASSGAELKEETFTALTPKAIFQLIQSLISNGKIIYGISFDTDITYSYAIKLSIDTSGTISQSTTLITLARGGYINTARIISNSEVSFNGGGGSTFNNGLYDIRISLYNSNDMHFSCSMIDTPNNVMSAPQVVDIISMNKSFTTARSGKIYYI